MNEEGPLLEALTHRLSECPGDFLDEPRAGKKGTVDVAAVVCDHLRAMGFAPEGRIDLGRVLHAGDRASANRLRLIAVACWLLHDEWFLKRPDLGPRMADLLIEGLDGLAGVVRAEAAIGDPDRREELVRVCLARLGLRPRGESGIQAADRLTALDSAERARVVRATREAEARAREVREAMARRAAEEAAAKVSRE
jgi:hypothetical protein